MADLRTQPSRITPAGITGAPAAAFGHASYRAWRFS